MIIVAIIQINLDLQLIWRWAEERWKLCREREIYTAGRCFEAGISDDCGLFEDSSKVKSALRRFSYKVQQRKVMAGHGDCESVVWVKSDITEQEEEEEEEEEEE